MTAGLEESDKFDTKQENVVKFKDNLEEVVSIHCNGRIVYTILIEHDNIRAVLTTANLLAELHLCLFRKGDWFCLTGLEQY